MHKALELKGIFGRRKSNELKSSPKKLSPKSKKQSPEKGKKEHKTVPQQHGDGNAERKKTGQLSLRETDQQGSLSDNDLEDPLGLKVKATDTSLDFTSGRKSEVTDTEVINAAAAAFMLRDTTSTQSCPSSPGCSSTDSSFMSSCSGGSSLSSPILATDSPMSSPNASPYKQVFQEEDSDSIHRIYRKVHPMPKSRMRRFLPSSPSRLTIADVGCQVNTAPDVTEVLQGMRSEVDQVTELASSYRIMVEETKDRLTNLEGKTSYLSEKNKCLERTHDEKDSELQGLREKLISQQKDLQHLQAEVLQERMRTEESLLCVRQQDSQIKSLKKQNEEAAAECRDLRNRADKAELNQAFIHEDKLDLQKELDERTELVAALRVENERVHKESQDYKYLYLETRLKSSEVLGKYLDELNLVMEEKRMLLEKHKVSSKTLAKMIEGHQNQSLLKEENHRLVDQVEYLTSRTVAQELHVEELQEQLSDLSRLLAAYERDAALNGHPVMDTRNSLVLKSDRAALKKGDLQICDKLSVATNSLDDSREIRTQNGSPMREKKSPDKRQERQHYSDLKLPQVPYESSDSSDDLDEFKSPREAGDSL